MSIAGIALTIASALFVTIANLLLRHAMVVSGFGFSMPQFLKLLVAPAFFVGLMLYFASMVIWFKVLTIEALSSCYPILVGVSFLGITLGAVFFFREAVPPMKLTGIIAVLAGIILIVRS